MQVSRTTVLYGLLVVLNLGLAQFGQQLAAGAVPIDPGWSWVVPIGVAMITGATTMLPKLPERGARGRRVQVRQTGIAWSQGVGRGRKNLDQG